MGTIQLELQDELIEKLAPYQDKLLELLELGLQTWQERERQEQLAAQGVLPAGLLQRQEQLMVQAHQLRAHLGDPIDGLVKLLSALPPTNDEFWLQVVETT